MAFTCRHGASHHHHDRCPHSKTMRSRYRPREGGFTTPLLSPERITGVVVAAVIAGVITVAPRDDAYGATASSKSRHAASSIVIPIVGFSCDRSAPSDVRAPEYVTTYRSKSQRDVNIVVS